jgi:hypothetical protein
MCESLSETEQEGILILFITLEEWSCLRFRIVFTFVRGDPLRFPDPVPKSSFDFDLMNGDFC